MIHIWENNKSYNVNDVVCHFNRLYKKLTNSNSIPSTFKNKSISFNGNVLDSLNLSSYSDYADKPEVTSSWMEY